MRARNIKPAFFIDSELSEVDFASRLLFIGLWCYADREGRFEWKPKQIKASIFPYDNVNIEKLLSNLMSIHVITSSDGVGYVENFVKHQHPHPHEAKSTLPEKPEQNQCHDMSLNVTECKADVMIIDTMIKDSNIKPLVDYSTEFLQFWQEYPKKKAKWAAWKEWQKAKPPIDEVLEAIEWQKESTRWQEGYILDPERYIKKRCWEDEPDENDDVIPQRPKTLIEQEIERVMRASNGH